MQALQEKGEKVDNVAFTLKDFVKIFRADKVGERISNVIKKEAIEKKTKAEAPSVNNRFLSPITHTNDQAFQSVQSLHTFLRNSQPGCLYFLNKCKTINSSHARSYQAKDIYPFKR